MTESKSHVDVLITGAGPTGLVSAIELTRRGLRCRLIEQLAEPVRYSKAQVIHARTLELLDQDGLAEALMARGIEIHGLSLFTPELKRLVHATFAGVPSRYQHMLSIPQHDTESVLSARASELGVQVERGVRLVDFTQDPDGVTATLTLASGEVQIQRGLWLLGCDGAHSTVRKTLGIPFEGATYEQRIIQADVRIDWSLAHTHDEVLGFIADAGFLGLFPLPGEKRYRMLTFVGLDETLEPVLETFQRLIDERGPEGSRVSEPAWMVDFRIHRRMVSQYRLGRVFLAGDAAHIHSPAGGQGMNTGIHDAMNLGWKLALVHKGTGRPEVLDSYNAERQPIAAATLRGTDTATRMFATASSVKNPIALSLREKIFEFVGGTDLISTRGARLASMLDINYPESPMVAQDRGAFVTLPSNRDAEPPGLRDWFDFGVGPAPGTRPPDLALNTSDPRSPRLFDSLRHPGHTLFLFDGAVHSKAGYQNLADIARVITERHGALVVPVLVVPLSERPSVLSPEVRVLLDPEGEAHRAYGARGECLYLIRPDGYVAYRSQPARIELLTAFLARVFVGA